MGTTARGIAAGAVGVVAMDVVTWAMYRREGPAEIGRELRARSFGMDTAHAMVRKVAGAVGSDAGTDQPNAAGIAVHQALGIVPAVLYARARPAVPGLGSGRGAMFGLALFVLNDEILAPALGVAGPPGAYPWQAHVRGLVGHVVLGMAVDAALRALED